MTRSEGMQQQKLIADRYYSGFPPAHDTYNALSKAHDGKIYYVLSSEQLKEGGKLCVHDPVSEKSTVLGDLTAICGETGKQAVVQGKSHSRFYEYGGRLFMATHVGYYELIEGMDRLPQHLPEGVSPYPGGHFLSYDPATGAFEDLATVPDGEGIVTMNMDVGRGQLFGITWPTGLFVHYDVNQQKLYNLGPISARGEAGQPGDDFRTLCRSLLIDPNDGSVYFTVSEGHIFRYVPGKQSIERLDVDLKRDYFGKYDPSRPGNMAYNWRKVFWYPPENVGYGVHGNSGYLFRFDPAAQSVELVHRLTSEVSQRSGMFDQFSYGYLGFQLGPDGETIYYLTGSPVYKNGKRVAGQEEIAKGASRGIENLHLVTYHLPSGAYADHGPIFYADGQRPSYVNSIAVGDNGYIYALARFIHEGREVSDLIRFPNPLFSGRVMPSHS